MSLNKNAFSKSTVQVGYGLKRGYKHLHVNIDYEVGGGFTVSSLTGFNDEYYSEMAELDNYDSSTLATVVTGAVKAPTPANGLLPYYNFPFAIERVNRDFSQELRLAFDNKGPLTAMIGANYLWTKTYRDLFNVQAEGVLGTVTNRSAGTASSPQQVRTWGIFGSVSYDITEQLTINLEGRYQRDKVYLFGSGLGATVSPAAAAALGIPAGTKAPFEEFYSQSFNNFMPRVILNYQVTPDLLVYGSWAKSANVSIASFNSRVFSGTAGEQAELARLGVQALTQPEKLSNFEVGVKGKLFDGKAIFTLAAYAAEWKDQYNSRSSFFRDTSVTPNINSTVTGIANSGRSLLKGVETDLTVVPTPGVTLAFSGAINDTNIRSFTDPSISRISGLIGNDFVGKSLPLTSKYSFSFSPAFEGDIPGRDNWTWMIRGDLSYKSKQYLDASNNTWISGRAVVNGRVGVKMDNIRVEVFATNLLNDKGYTSIQQNTLQVPAGTYATGPFSYLVVGLPTLRTFGLKGAVTF